MGNFWIIKDADGNVTNPGIKGEESWVKAHFDYVEELIVPSIKIPFAVEERAWRDQELRRTDVASSVNDFPNRDNILKYRVLLRDWPSTADFPNKRPTVPS
tara:strand:- start:275 stop:577 length:303 start_codon:yes stop_codon:yes gene_type:complete